MCLTLLQNWCLNCRIQGPWRPSSNLRSPEPSPPQPGSWPLSRAAWPGPPLSPWGAFWGLCALKPWQGKSTLLFLSCTHSHTPTLLTPDKWDLSHLPVFRFTVDSNWDFYDNYALIYFTDVELICNAVLIPAVVQLSDSVILNHIYHIYIYSFSYSFLLWFITGY